MLDLLIQLDQNILLFIQEYIRQDWMNWLWKGITHLGDEGIIWIILTVILLIPKKTRKAGLASVFALLISLLITNVCIKNTVARIRPYEVIDGLRLMIEGLFLPVGTYVCFLCGGLRVLPHIAEKVGDCSNRACSFNFFFKIVCRSTLSE